MNRFLDLLLVLPQYILPQHTLSLAVYKLTRCKIPWVKNLLIKTFLRSYDIDMSRAVIKDPALFDSFNHFFTRAMEDIPFSEDENTLLSPCDGVVSQYGHLQEGMMIQAKGHEFSVYDLLALQTMDEKKNFQSGSYATVYLSPKDYHRIHMPLDGHLLQMTYIPGDLFAVNQRTTRVVNHLFSRNERVVCRFQSQPFEFYLVMVGAIFVGNMETVWAGEVNRIKDRKIRTFDYSRQEQSITLKRGEEMGRFNMGSTVIMVIPNHNITFQENAFYPSVKTGDSIASLH